MSRPSPRGPRCLRREPASAQPGVAVGPGGPPLRDRGYSPRYASAYLATDEAYTPSDGPREVCSCRPWCAREAPRVEIAA